MTYERAVCLTGQSWNHLSDTEKVEVLQSIENHVAVECGRINCIVEACFLHTGTDGIVLGCYDPNTRRIYINLSQFDAESMYGKNSESIVTVCLHEGRHAYQHQVVEGVVHDDSVEAEEWKYNLSEEHYISFRENPRAYYYQPVEVDARTFSEQRYQQLEREREVLSNEESEKDNHSTATNIFANQMKKTSNYDLVADYHVNQENGMNW